MEDAARWVIHGLAVVGLWTVLWLGGRWLWLSLSRRGDGGQAIPVVIAVRDRGEWIEGILRQLLLPLTLDGGTGDRPAITVVDLGSQDDTREILIRLSRRYPAVNPLFWDDDSNHDWFTVAASPVTIVVDLQQSADVTKIPTVVSRLLK